MACRFACFLLGCEGCHAFTGEIGPTARITATRARCAAGASRMAAVVIPPHCPSCRAPVTLACPNLKEALIVCSDEAVRPVPRVPATPG